MAHLTSAAFFFLAAPAFAQTVYPENEPNNSKPQANILPLLVSGDSIVGRPEFSFAAPRDYFKIKTAPMPLAIYEHRLLYPSVAGLSIGASVVGVRQTFVPGVGGTATTLEANVGTAERWYGFGRSEEFFCNVQALVSCCQASTYSMTLATTLAPITVIATPFESAGPIAISTMGTSTQDTSLRVFDSTLHPIPGYSNDDEMVTGTTTQSHLSRTYAPGVYYLAVGLRTAWNFPAPGDDNITAANINFRGLTEFPDVLVSGTQSNSAQTWDFRIFASNGSVFQPASLPVHTGEVLWFQFTVSAGAPAVNDACANATSIRVGEAYTQSFAGATNDGSSACDPGGSNARDVWFSYTNPGPDPVVLRVDTCGSASDTALSILSSCAGPELACNDDNGSVACGPTASRRSSIVSSGQTVRIRVSDKGLPSTNFVLHTAVEPSNDECSAPQKIVGPGLFTIENDHATVSSAGQSEALCAFVGGPSIQGDLWYAYTPIISGPVRVSTCGFLAGSPSDDSKIAVYAGTNCPVPGSAIACSDSTVPACPSGSANNATVTFNAVCGTQYLIQIGMSPQSSSSLKGSFEVAEQGPAVGAWCFTPSTKFCTGDAVGTNCLTCGNNGASGHGCANSMFAAGADLSSSGVASVTAALDTLVLTATNITGPALFLSDTSLLQHPVHFGDGMYCLNSGVVRMGIVFPNGGAASYPGGSTPAAIHLASGPTTGGLTRYYVAYYRDAATFCGASTFNFTSVLGLTWFPGSSDTFTRDRTDSLARIHSRPRSGSPGARPRVFS